MFLFYGIAIDWPVNRLDIAAVNDGGVLVSTCEVRQRRHAEDGSLAS
jgi:hypothetical protein